MLAKPAAFYQVWSTFPNMDYLESESHSPNSPQYFSLQWPMHGNMGYTVVTHIDGSAFRYTEWVKYDNEGHSAVWSEVAGVEMCKLPSKRGSSLLMLAHAS